MGNPLVNLCSRCGKPRIASKKWTEKVKIGDRVSIIVHTETICSDPKCQKKVDEELSAVRQKRLEIEKEREKRGEEQKTRRVNIKI